MFTSLKFCVPTVIAPMLLLVPVPTETTNWFNVPNVVKLLVTTVEFNVVPVNEPAAADVRYPLSLVNALMFVGTVGIVGLPDKLE